KQMKEVQLHNLGRPNNMRFGPKTYLEGGCEVPNSRGYEYFDRARLFDQFKPSKRAAEGKDQECRPRAETMRHVDTIMGRRRWCFRNVERAGEDGAPQGWTPIP
ncbi:hypothetical protein B9Z19DRAFT_1076338, partial [Tuber borchii]